MSNKHIVCLSLLAIVLLVNAALIVYTTWRPFTEHFVQQEAEDAHGLERYIRTAFLDRHLRNPTPKEVDKYMALKDKEAIKRFMDEEIKPIVIDETAPSVATSVVPGASAPGVATPSASASGASASSVAAPSVAPLDKDNSGLFNKALKDTLHLIDTAGGKGQQQQEAPKAEIVEVSDVTFSKAFIQTKIGNIERQLDDLKRLL